LQLGDGYPDENKTPNTMGVGFLKGFGVLKKTTRGKSTVYGDAPFKLMQSQMDNLQSDVDPNRIANPHRREGKN